MHKKRLVNQATSNQSMIKDIRSVLRFNKSLGLTIPKKYVEKIGLHWKDHLEVFMVDEKTIGIQRLETNI